MPAIDPEKMPEKIPDRKLGDEWLDWDGQPQSNETKAPAWVFLLLAGAVMIGWALLWWAGLWLVAPRLQQLYLGFWIKPLAWIGLAYALLWWVSLVGASLGLKWLRHLVRLLGGIRWIMGGCILAGSLVGLSRDRVSHAFLLIYNRMEILPPLIQDPGRLLILAPRCLHRDSMQALHSLKERYGFSQVIAVGGNEARKAIATLRPQGLIAVACERDLWAGLKDLHGRVPALAFANQRPEGPCKNTLIDPAALEAAIRLFLGKRQQSEE